MRKLVLLSALLAIVAAIVFAFIPKDEKCNATYYNKINNGQGIQFIEADWSKALTEAKKQDKLIFLDAFASWCGPCKLLKRKTFPDKTVGDFFNKSFINVAIDMEKGDGPSLAEKFAVDAYPTLIITDKNGNIVTYTQGFISPKQLIDFGEYGLRKKKN